MDISIYRMNGALRIDNSAGEATMVFSWTQRNFRKRMHHRTTITVRYSH